MYQAHTTYKYITNNKLGNDKNKAYNIPRENFLALKQSGECCLQYCNEPSYKKA